MSDPQRGHGRPVRPWMSDGRRPVRAPSLRIARERATRSRIVASSMSRSLVNGEMRASHIELVEQVPHTKANKWRPVISEVEPLTKEAA